MKKSNSRFEDSLGYLFEQTSSDESHTVHFITSSTDIGVRRNQGRPGARFAPKVILNQLKKLNNHLIYKAMHLEEIANQENERLDFENSQKADGDKIYKVLKSAQHLIHIGGGHDHALPMLLAMDKLEKCKNILIINLDAHCDTRVDDRSHSGTPFRDYDLHAKKNFFLYQIGIHQFANSPSTLSELKNGKMYIDYMEHSKSFSAERFDQIIKSECPFEINKETLIYLSLDCDAIDGSIMQAVSAPNHSGLKLDYIEQIISHLKTKSSPRAFGIYEYNPLFDNLSSSSARSLAYLIEKYLN